MWKAGHAASGQTGVMAGWHRRLCLVIGLIALVLAWGAASAGADGDSVDYLPNTSFEDLEDGLDAGLPNVANVPTTNAQAAEELPHKNLDRAEALELMRSVFWSYLQSSAGVFDELEGAKLLSPNVAVVDPVKQEAYEQDESGPALIESTLPLSINGSADPGALVDLDLDSSGGDIEPSNPLVDVEIPTELNEGILLPEQQVTIDLPNTAGDRSPTTVAQSTAFYPNVALDSDLVVAPTPTGVETFTQLRSGDAPHTLTFELTLPDDCTLQATPDGGAEVRCGGDRTILVPSPFAIDAQGRDVPVSLSVSESTVTLDVSPDVHAAYPLLVDPFYETFDWDKLVGFPPGDPLGWKTETNTNLYDLSPYTLSPYEGQKALTVRSPGPYKSLSSGNRASWQYYVPKYFSDYEKYGVRPTTYIDHVTVKELEFRFPGLNPSKQYSPYFVGGIYDRVNNAFVSIAVRSGVDGQLTDPLYQYEFQNPNSNVNAKDFGIYLSSNQQIASAERQLWAGYKIITLSDKDNPAFDSLGSPSQWMNDKPTGMIPFTVTDPGLGVSSINIANPRPANTPIVTINKQGCVGGAENHVRERGRTPIQGRRSSLMTQA